MRKLAVIVAVVLGLAGCANSEVPSAGSTEPTTPPTSTAESTEPTSAPRDTSTTTAPSTPTPSRTLVPSGGLPLPPGANEVTLEGVIQDGVEAGCTILVSQGAQYLLLGGDPAALRAGQRVFVRGTAQPGVATTCQQGVPFIVAEVRPG